MPKVSAARVSHALPADSLARAFLLASRGRGGDRGRSLAEVVLAPAGELPATRASAQELAYGALRRFGEGDALLGQLLERPLAKPEVRALLLCALHRLDARPDAAHTIVDQAVEAAGQLARGAFRGLVNGVLRSYLQADKPAFRASWRRSRMPSSRLVAEPTACGLPESWLQIVAVGNALPPMSLRVNRRHLTRDDYRQRLSAVGIESSPVGDAGLRLARPQPVEALPGFTEGWVSVQDAGAQRAAELLDVAAGQRVLDACAAPGARPPTCSNWPISTCLHWKWMRCGHGASTKIWPASALKARVLVTDCRKVKSWWDGRPFDRILADVPYRIGGRASSSRQQMVAARGGYRQFCADTAADSRRVVAHPRKRWQTSLRYLLGVSGREPGAGRRFRRCRPDVALLGETQLLPQEDHDRFYYALLQKAR